MYESYYKFREKPFSLLPDPGFLFLSKNHRMALAMLEYGLMNQAGFTVITGEIGSGKTTLIRQLLNQIENDGDIRVGLVSNTHRSFGELLQWILLAFKLEYRGKEKVELYHTLADFLLRRLASQLKSLDLPDFHVVNTLDTCTRAQLGATGESGDCDNEIHPSRAGYKKLARKLAKAISDELGLQEKPEN